MPGTSKTRWMLGSAKILNGLRIFRGMRIHLLNEYALKRDCGDLEVRVISGFEEVTKMLPSIERKGLIFNRK